MKRVSWESLHDVALCLFVGQRDRRDKVRSKVDAEDRYRSKWKRNIGDDEEEERRYFGDVARQSIGNGFL